MPIKLYAKDDSVEEIFKEVPPGELDDLLQSYFMSRKELIAGNHSEFVLESTFRHLVELTTLVDEDGVERASGFNVQGVHFPILKIKRENGSIEHYACLGSYEINMESVVNLGAELENIYYSSRNKSLL